MYVKSMFKCGKESLDDDSLCQHVRDGKRLIVTGFGGIGKTIFCKYLFISIFKNPKGKIPIFFELRRINDISQKDLATYLRVSTSAEDEVVTDEVFKAMMADGRFIFILDGFDEIPDEHRNGIQRQILELAHLYPDCGVVVSSRFDDRFASWQEFYVYQALPFSKEQTRLVIEKAKFEPDTKKEFMANIFEKRYDDYKGFFSTPLLTLMMMMTYLQIRHIPDNVHIFYRYAFQTLFTLHDASKQGFQRNRRLKLSEQEFLEVFSIYCLSSYSDMEHTFNEAECINYIDRAKKRTGKSFESKDFLFDAVESVNLLFKDGDQYSFIHRSFQEYFSAYAITHFFVKPIRQVLRMIPLRESDSVFSMVYSMNPALVEEVYIIPEFDDASAKMRGVLKETSPIRILGLSEYRISFSFFSRERGAVPFVYRFYGSSEFENFVNSIYLMFKETAPKDLSRSPRSAGLIKSASFISRYLKSRSLIPMSDNTMVDVSFDFEKEQLDVSHRQEDNPSSVDGSFSVPLSDIKWDTGLPIVGEISQRLKDRCAFVKRRVDEIKRNFKKSRDTSDDILSL